MSRDAREVAVDVITAFVVPRGRGYFDEENDACVQADAAIITADRKALVGEIADWLLGPARIEYDESGSEEHFSWWASDTIVQRWGTKPC